MTLITGVIFLALLVIPKLFFNEKKSVFEDYYSVEYNIGWKTPAKNNQINMGSELNSETEILEKEIKLEDWMLEPLEWDME